MIQVATVSMVIGNHQIDSNRVLIITLLYLRTRPIRIICAAATCHADDTTVRGMGESLHQILAGAKGP